VEKGDKHFNSPKSSKVKKVFSLLKRAVRLNFSSYKCKLLKFLKFSLTALLTSKSTFLTFDLLGLLKRLSPFSTEPFNFQLVMSLPAMSLRLRFCASRKGGTGGGGRVSTMGPGDMAASGHSCRKPLVGTGWAISLLLCTNELKNGLLAM